MSDILWIKIEESLKNEGCPICFIMSRSIRHYLESLLYEYVLDVGVRKKLHKSVGFCTNHAYMLLNIIKRLNDDGSKIAILYETILGEEIKKLEALRRESKNKFKLKRNFWAKFSRKEKFENILDKLNPTGECPACFQERSTESLYIDEFYNQNERKEFRSLFESENVFLCRSHFIEILKRCVEKGDQEAFDYFADVQISKLKKLLDDMVKFIDKHDYRHKGTFEDNELKSWRMALEYFSSKEDIIRAWADVRQFNTKL